MDYDDDTPRYCVNIESHTYINNYNVTEAHISSRHRYFHASEHMARQTQSDSRLYTYQCASSSAETPQTPAYKILRNITELQTKSRVYNDDIQCKFVSGGVLRAMTL